MTATPPPIAALALTLGLLVAQRLFELVLSARHLRTLKARGAVEWGRGTFAGFVVLHTLFPAALAGEVLLASARPPSFWPWLLAPLFAAEALRVAAMRTLGERWHVRVWVVPGEAPVARGIYRYLRHPNYVAVVLELALIPALFGAWRTALAAGLVNALLLWLRIGAEDRALRWAAQEPARSASDPPDQR